MTYLTRAQALTAARQAGRSVSLAEAELQKTARLPPTQQFDIFLSHSMADAQVVFGIMELLEREGLSVYVDWVIDPQLNRRAVTAGTADILRTRMKHCGVLLYATSATSSKSKWMPWELGFFDGHRGAVGILPVVDAPGQGFVGMEYLGLYPRVELAQLASGHRRFGIYSKDRRSVETVEALARSR